MKEIVVVSGKGGTGKTSITSSFAYLGGESLIVADCDVDAADMYLIMKPSISKREDFYSGYIAQIDETKCIKCGKCVNVCRFDAIDKEKLIVSDINCEGCAYCSYICPSGAIKMKECLTGELLVGETRYHSPFVYAYLGVGGENSGKLVSKVRKEAKALAVSHSKEYILVDGSPGVGCPVISSITGADYVVIVTEATVAGFHDMKRVFELIKKNKISCGCIINKYDLSETICSNISDFIKDNNIDYLGHLPYDTVFTKAMNKGISVVEYTESSVSKTIKQMWNKVKTIN